jgi:hypothetical protein
MGKQTILTFLQFPIRAGRSISVRNRSQPRAKVFSEIQTVWFYLTAGTVRTMVRTRINGKIDVAPPGALRAMSGLSQREIIPRLFCVNGEECVTQERAGQLNAVYSAVIATKNAFLIRYNAWQSLTLRFNGHINHQAGTYSGVIRGPIELSPRTMFPNSFLTVFCGKNLDFDILTLIAVWTMSKSSRALYSVDFLLFTFPAGTGCTGTSLDACCARI